jgi:hypothetical protein
MRRSSERPVMGGTTTIGVVGGVPGGVSGGVTSVTREGVLNTQENESYLTAGTTPSSSPATQRRATLICRNLIS